MVGTGSVLAIQNEIKIEHRDGVRTAECGERIHCLVSVVALKRVSLAPLPIHLHIVITCRSCTVYTLPESA
jgi:hypothetical protein